MPARMLALVAVRSIGLLMILLPVPEIWSIAHWYACQSSNYGLWNTLTSWPPLFDGGGSNPWSRMGAVAQLGAGLYLLLGGRRMAGLVARTRRGRCLACGYDVSGICTAAGPAA